MLKEPLVMVSVLCDGCLDWDEADMNAELCETCEGSGRVLTGVPLVRLLREVGCDVQS